MTVCAVGLAEASRPRASDKTLPEGAPGPGRVAEISGEEQRSFRAASHRGHATWQRTIGAPRRALS